MYALDKYFVKRVFGFKYNDLKPTQQFKISFIIFIHAIFRNFGTDGLSDNAEFITVTESSYLSLNVKEPTRPTVTVWICVNNIFLCPDPLLYHSVVPESGLSNYMSTTHYYFKL